MCTHYFSDDMLWWYFKQEWKNNSHFNQFQMAASTVLIQQVPFSFSRYRSLAYILMSRYLLFKFALPFSLVRTYKRLVQPYRGFLRLCRYSKTFLRTFITHIHIQSLPRSRGAATIAENWSLTERRFRHLERTVLGRYLLSCHIVNIQHVFLYTQGIQSYFRVLPPELLVMLTEHFPLKIVSLTLDILTV